MSTADPAPAPALTVVVIVHDDAARLPNAVRSVLRQTLRSLEVVIVDDASTDGTAEVAAALVAEDPRVRATTLPVNSGGCGRPRNVGIELSTAPTVMFLDSDDRLERHACKNLLEALEDTGSDFAVGAVRREYVSTGGSSWWFRGLFDERRVVHGLADEPGFVEDVLSVNKLYRREFLDRTGLRFPEDVHFEDQLFSIQAYTEARSWAVIPEMVYVWNVYQSAGRRSITQRRGEIASLRHRLEVHRRIDAYIAARGDADLQRLKDQKFLRNDLRLYLRDVLLDDGVIERVLEEAGPYLRSIPADRYEDLTMSLRVVYGMALRGDVVGLRQAVQWNHHHVLALEVGRHGDRARVAARGSDTAPDPRWAEDALENTLLEVDPWVLDAPLPSVNLLHELTGVQQRGMRLVLRGRTVDPMGKLDDGDHALSLRLVRQAPRPTVTTDLPLTVVGADGHERRWEVEVGLPALAAAQDAVWVAYLLTRVRARTVRQPLLWALPPHAVEAGLPVWMRALGRAFEVAPTETGRPQLRVLMSRGLREKAGRRVETRVLPALRRRTRSLRPGSSSRWGRRAYAQLRRLPIRDDLVVFEAHLGTVYADSPKYVYEEMRRSRPGMRAVWVLPEGHEPPHPDVELVTRGSTAYLRALATARYWVDNQTFPGYVRKRPGQRYLQTWHGIPLKKMGRDVPGGKPVPLHPDRGVGAWDLLCVPNPYFEKVFVPAFGTTAELVRYGTPRNDPLVDGSLTREDARAALDVPPHARVVAYVPTFRESSPGATRHVELPVDVEELVGGLPQDVVLLVRAHYLNTVAVPGHLRYRVLDTTPVEDVNLVYAAADVLVTDYSSVMFDYAHLDRPMVFHVPDLDEYLAARGTYVDLPEIAPGPLTGTTAELAAALRSALDGEDVFADRRAGFRERWCGLEDGRASARALEALLGEGER
ncbi:CDP-glycerol glycerophosphotransferase family protein [Oryzobacter sp. R7]|uniref:bifunctional glycosyltransferase/CDP-glycerol:glycerophosphate glycerophosphotransferase n=1 Tax=Oryzobacter faecalis TaxID=3388656 RepID=UPI00398D5B34